MTNQMIKNNILVVDDEDDILSFLKIALKDAGFKVRTAKNSMEALDRLREEIPDLISLDIVMPGGSGLKFFREMKKNPQWAKIPVIVVTGHARDDLGKADLNEMTMSGPGIYLEKPVTAEKYVNAVNQVLGVGPTPEKKQTADLKARIANELESLDQEALSDVFKMIKSRKQD
ncbi:MAG: response regulator [bacterium]